MKLKTLKDLALKTGLDTWDAGGEEQMGRIKAEAIKWVGYVRELGLDEMIWMEFFNITEDDLK